MTLKKILFVNGCMHRKNMHGLQLLKNIQIDVVDNIEQCSNLSEYMFVYYPSHPTDISKYPHTKFVFGPHFSVFPEEEQLRLIKGPNCVYVQPSQWAVDVWKCFPCCQDLSMKVLPFCVDTEQFQPNKHIDQRKLVMVYSKCRKPEELEQVETLLQEKGYSYRVFHYEYGYDETDFQSYLKDCQFGIWLGRHESQGFALLETLSCDVPLLIWNVTSMNQEYGSSYADYKATVIPYWDTTCGETFYESSELNNTFQQFIFNLNFYKPRDYVLNHLSAEICEKYLTSLF